MNSQKTKRTFALTILLAGVLAVPFAMAAVPPPSGDLFDVAKTDVGAITTEGATVAWSGEGAAKMLQAQFPAGNGYPAFAFPIAGGSWDLSAYSGVQVDITNTGDAAANVALRVDNAGDWQKQPWNTESVTVKPGETKTLKVNFGKSYGGNAGYALDSKAITALKVFVITPKNPVTVTLKNLKAFGTAPAPTTPTVGTPVTAVAPLNAAPGASLAGAGLPATGLFDVAKADAAAFQTQGGASVAIVGEGGTRELQAKFADDAGYPAFDFPAPAGGYDLSKYAGVQVDVINKGDVSANIALRVDNAGDWKKNPFNTESVWVKVGETKTLKVTFGKSYGGGPGYALDASKITNLKIFAINPKAPVTIALKNLMPFGVAGAAPVAPAATQPAATTTAIKAGVMSPPISGELTVVDGKTDANTFKTQSSSASVENGALKVVFEAGKGYPNVQFPIPAGGWNLSAFGGIQVDVTNPGTTDAAAFLRVDNPGDWRKSPWNTERLRIPAGQTKTLKMVFGEQNGAPAYALDALNISAIQVFLENPKQETTLLFNNLKAYGSPRPKASNLSFSAPEDRDKPVVPAAWVGTKPPVDGSWVQTLNENFDGPTLNEKLWRTTTWWNGLLAGQTQRYSKDNLIFENGILKMKTEKRRGHQNDDPTLPEKDYTTGHIISYDKWTQLYGYFEARIKVPTARGLWPAFWMMPDRGPAAGPEGWKRESTSDGGMEMDIVEHLTEWGAGRNNVAVHWDGYGDQHKSWGTTDVYYGPTADGWHNYGLLWEPGKLTWFIDGVKKAEFANERVGSVPNYLLLNVQMGGWATKDVDEAKLPDYYQIDYVRAWQLKDRIKQ